MYHVLGDARADPRASYGLSPGELRRRFETVGGWEVALSVETVFERRWSCKSAYSVGLRRR